jgi:hypothetical protein
MALLVLSQEPAKHERSTQPFMRQKLVFAQGLLEGITLEKFDLVLTNATRLRDMTHTNVFLVLGNPDYRSRVTSFQARVDALSAAAKATDPARCFDAYTKVTESCVECHKYFRREQFKKHNMPPAPLRPN